MWEDKGRKGDAKLCSGGSNEPLTSIYIYIYIIYFFVSLILRFFLKNIIFAHPDLNFILDCKCYSVINLY